MLTYAKSSNDVCDALLLLLLAFIYYAWLAVAHSQSKLYLPCENKRFVGVACFNHGLVCIWDYPSHIIAFVPHILVIGKDSLAEVNTALFEIQLRLTN